MKITEQTPQSNLTFKDVRSRQMFLDDEGNLSIKYSINSYIIVAGDDGEISGAIYKPTKSIETMPVQKIFNDRWILSMELGPDPVTAVLGEV